MAMSLDIKLYCILCADLHVNGIIDDTVDMYIIIVDTGLGCLSYHDKSEKSSYIGEPVPL